jgi:hypothetical protein
MSIELRDLRWAIVAMKAHVESPNPELPTIAEFREAREMHG